MTMDTFPVYFLLPAEARTVFYEQCCHAANVMLSINEIPQILEREAEPQGCTIFEIILQSDVNKTVIAGLILFI